MTLIKPEQRDVLLVIDVQNDFCPGGSLAVPRGHEVVPVINDLAVQFDHFVLTQDWHPQGHSSFASSHTGREEFSEIPMPYGPQTYSNLPKFMSLNRGCAKRYSMNNVTGFRCSLEFTNLAS